MVKESNFDEIYPVKEYYQRFNRENTAFKRAERMSYMSYDDVAIKRGRMKKGTPGFRLIDYAFRDGALTIAKATGSGRGVINSGLYSWFPLGSTIIPEGPRIWEVSPQKAAKVISKAGMYYGASDIGFCVLDKRWLYSHTIDGRPIVFEDVKQGYTTDKKAVIPESHRWVVAITVPMEVQEMMYAPAALNPDNSMGYSRMLFVASSLAEFIRGLGYNAIPCGNDTALSVPIAIQAGLGHAGRNGRLITWKRGLMVRIAKIFTDLPLAPSSAAPKGIIEYCQVCAKCAKHCPSQSISHGDRDYKGYSEANNPGVLKWYCNADTCLEYWRKSGSSCAICFRVCSFTKPEGVLHDIVKWFIRNVPQLNKFWVWSDEVLGYGEFKDPKEYWET